MPTISAWPSRSSTICSTSRAPPQELGKTPGKDAAAGKANFVSILGVERARAQADHAGATGGAHLEPFGEAADLLRQARNSWLRAAHEPARGSIGGSMTGQSTTPLLDTVDVPADIRRLKPDQLRQLADELRQETIEAVSVTGGHLGAGLGVVELTVALHYVFNTPKDRLIWDVGHQAYPHKILTGRRNRIRTLRQGGGLSGFTARSESEYDPFGAAHASTSISAALGMAVARDLAGGNNNVVAVIGDGAMSAGMAYEAMNNAGALRSRLIVVLNDNDMSIAPPVGAMWRHLSRLLSGRPYVTLRNLGRTFAEALPKPLEIARASAPRNSPAAWWPAAPCSRSWASTMSARSTGTISTICCRC